MTNDMVTFIFLISASTFTFCVLAAFVGAYHLQLHKLRLEDIDRTPIINVKKMTKNYMQENINQ